MLFSKRLPSDVRSDLSIPVPLRQRILYVLRENTHPGQWTMQAEVDDAEYEYRKQLGREDIIAFNEINQRVKSDFDGVLKKGYPSEALDMVEAFLAVVRPVEQITVQRALNKVLSEERFQWRLIDGEFVKLDSGFLAESVIAAAHSLLQDASFPGPLGEFEGAIHALSAGEYGTAITKANNALESTMKAVLNVQRMRPGALVENLVSSGFVPEYQKGFLTAFESILRSVSAERNEPGRGHGQGKDIVEVGHSLAEFCVHLAGTLIVFIIRRYREKTELDLDDIDPEDLPF